MVQATPTIFGDRPLGNVWGAALVRYWERTGVRPLRMLHPRRPSIKILLGTLLALAIGAAQEETSVFRSDTTLVEFTIIALDGKGNPISDLKPEEITIRENGHDRDLAFLRYEGGEQEETTQQLPAGAFSNRPAIAPGPPRNVTAILLDSLNTTPRDQVFARAQVLKILTELGPNTRVAVYLLARDLEILHDFTDDPESLREKVAKTKMRVAMQATDDIATMAIEAQALIQSFSPQSQAFIVSSQTAHLELSQMANEQTNERRTRKTLESLEALGLHLSGIPGRKSIVWVTGGIQMLSVKGQMGNGPRGGIKSYDAWVRDTARQLATQGVAMYAVDARGNLGPAAMDGMDVERRRVSVADRGERGLFELQAQAAKLSSDPLPAMEKLASITGGRAIFHTNDLNRGVRAVVSDVKGTYSLAFYAVDEPDDRWHDIEVRVSRKGVKLRHGKGYMATAPAPTARPWTEQEWGAAISSPISSTLLPIDARASLSQETDTKEVTLTVQFDARPLRYRSDETGTRFAFAELAFVDKAPNGAFAIKRKPLVLPFNAEQPDQPFRIEYSWELMSEATTVRVILHDQLTGQYGTLDLPVAELPQLTAQPSN